MNKTTFKSKLYALYNTARKITGNISYDSAVQACLAAAGRYASVNLETFSKLVLGYDLEMFADPREDCARLRDETVEKMQSEGTFNVHFPTLMQACNLIYGQLGLQPAMFDTVSPKTAADSLPTNTSTGAWFFSRPKGEWKAPALDRVHDILTGEKFSELIESSLAVISWRTQERQSGTKFRQIFVMAYEFNILEAMFAFPIFEHFRSFKDTSYSFDAIWLDNARLWNKLQDYPYIISIDYKSFDNNCSLQAIFAGLNFIKSLFKLTGWKARLYDAIVRVHISCNIVTSYNNEPYIFNKRSGVLSGSVFTNFLGSIINLIYINYTLINMGYDPRDFFIKVKGDDVVIGSKVRLDMDTFIKIQSTSFGSIIPKESVRFYQPGEPIFFLGYYFTNKVKFASSEDLLHRKIAISGRFISEDDMPESVRVISKIISVLTNVSNGKEIFNRVYRSKYLQYYDISELPEYYHDLSENERQPFILGRIKNIQTELTYGWMYK